MSTSTIVTNELSQHPTGFSGVSSYSNSDVENGYTDSTSATYARIYLTRGQNAVTNVFYNFPILNIPSDATINSISCSVKCSISNTTASRVQTRIAQILCGNEVIGNAHTVDSSTTAFNMDIGTLTASDISGKSFRIQLYAIRGSSSTNTSYYFQFYGATLNINYTYNQIVYEITSVSNVPGVSMSPASANIYAGDGRSFEIVGDLTNVEVTDNYIDVTSDLVPQTGGSVSAIYTLSNVNDDHVIVFNISGNKVYVKRNGVWKKARNVKVKVNGVWENIEYVHKKVNGYWQSMADRSVMFDQNALYIDGNSIPCYGPSSFIADNVPWCMEEMSLSTVASYVEALQTSTYSNAKPTIYTKTGSMTFNNEQYFTYSPADFNGTVLLGDYYVVLVPANYSFIRSNTVSNCGENLAITEIPYYLLTVDSMQVYSSSEQKTRNLIDYTP